MSLAMVFGLVSGVTSALLLFGISLLWRKRAFTKEFGSYDQFRDQIDLKALRVIKAEVGEKKALRAIQARYPALSYKDARQLMQEL